ncbi:hypothetical protein JCM9279_000016 [Rhodotorula babjevae]
MQHAEPPLAPPDADPHPLSPPAATNDDDEPATTTRGEHVGEDAARGPLAPEGQQQGAPQAEQGGAGAGQQASAAQQGDERARGPQGDAPAGEEQQRALEQQGSVEGVQQLSSSLDRAQPGAAPAQGDDRAGSALASTGDDEPPAFRPTAVAQDSPATTANEGTAVPLEQPKPSNPARETSSLLGPPPPSLSVTDDTASASAPEADSPAPTPPPPSSSSPAPSTAAAAAARTASPALSASPGPGATSSSSERPHPAKKFQSSLAVNKKFLEKAGEKAKPEVKPVISRVATSPAPPPVSSTHPRLLAGKLSSGPSLSLGTGASSTSSSPGTSTTGWGAKKPSTPTPGSSSSAAGASAAGAAGGAQGAKGGPVWGSPAAAAAAAGGGASSSGPAPLGQQQEQRAPPSQPQTQAYVPGGMRGGPHGARGGGPGGPGGWGGARNMEMDFPTAAEAANAKDARQKAVADQVQARERASQARAAAAAAHNAHLLEELDAFRGVHLDPNAAHWDEADDDDFLDTTIEFADGTQYKLDAAPPTPAAADELREPGPRELALRERPLAPGEVVEQPKREERFGDDYDRSWPRRPSRSAGENRNLFNDRLGKLEPAAHGAVDAAHPPPRRAGAEPTSILRSGAGAHSDLPPHLALGGHVPPPTSGRRPSITSPRLNSHAPLHPVGRRESAHEPSARPLAWGGAGQRRPSSTAHAGPSLGAAAGAQDRQLPPHLAARAAAAAQAPLSPPRGARRPSVPAASAVLPTSPTRPAASSKQAQPLAAPPAVDTPSSTDAAPAPAPAVDSAAPASAAPEVAAPPQPSIEELHAREMHAAAERARKRREEEEQKRLEQSERARKKAQELEEKMRAADEAKAKEKREKEEAARPPPREREKERRPSVAAAQPAPPVAPADKATSWRAVAKPLPSQAAAASAAAAGRAPAGASSRSQAREQPPASVAAPPPAAAAEPTSILLRPSTSSSAPPAQQQPAQPSAWRRPSASSAAPPAGAARAPVRQLPPHLAAQVAQAEAKAAAAAAAAPPPPPPVEAAPPPAAEVAKPTTPPPQPSLALVSPPTSPSQERKRHDPTAAAKHGYKLPAVSQFDDLMSRIKGVMAQPSDADDAPASSSKDAGAAADAPAAKTDGAAPTEAADGPVVEVPTVKLPPRTRASKAAARAAAAALRAEAQAQQHIVSLPATDARGRGRGRADAARPGRQAAPVPAFESREPVLPHHSSRVARSQSPPPAWRQYTIRLAAQPPRRPVAARVLKNFTNTGFPKPLYPFSWEPVLKDVNPRRLNRDDMLLPKKYDKHGMPIYVVALPKRRFSARSSAIAHEDEPEIVVSISSVALVRQVALEPPAATSASAFDPAQALAEGHVVDVGFAPFSGKGRADARASEASAAWRREGGEGAAEAAPFALGGANGQEAKFTGALNGEKIEATPRKVTTAPGRDANGLSKPPTSPTYKPQDLSQVTSSPSAAAPWASKKLTYSALDPTASSVWSAAPEEGSVHARHIAASNLPENSLQGIVDEDPSEALPSSLAELKSEDGHSNADHKELAKQGAVTKDEAKLRAAAPSFSSFLHESAAAVDPSMSPSAAPLRHGQQQQPHSYSGFPGQGVPQPSASPIAGYSASQPYSPAHLYGQVPQRPMSQQPQHALYPGYPGQAPSPFATQPIHQAYSTSPFAAASPIPPTHGYPSPYRESASPALPHGITNPALIASYSSYGLQPQMAAPGGPGRGYGAVGAIGGPPGPGPIGRPPHQQQPQQQHGAPGSGMYGRAQASVGYHLGGGGGGPGQYGHSFQHAHQQHQQQQQHGGAHPGAPYRMDSYGSNDGRPLSAQLGGGGPSAYGPPPPPSAGTTMASPVIMPQQLPPVPHFSPGHPGHHVQLGSSPVASAAGMGMGVSGFGGAYGHGYGQGGYGYAQQQQQRMGGGAGAQSLGRPPQGGGARW